jgi:hypothetical protein
MKQQDVFENYFNGEGCFRGLGLPTLEANYQWKVPDCPFLKIDRNASLFKQNIELKHLLQRLWCDDIENRLSLSKWVVSEWGGIRGNRPERLQAYLSQAAMPEPLTRLQGIASFSKILAASDPTRFAIYDARVAVSLNVVQIAGGVSLDGLAFPYLPGRNNVVGHVEKNAGFSQNKANKPKELAGRLGWRLVGRNDAYRCYLDLLSSISKRLRGTAIYHLEMALFADAERLCTLLMDQTAEPK